MKLYAPKYYKDFTCIADKCTHSCCIGWEIDIDEATLNKYKTLSHPYGEAVKNSISISETPHFKLCKDDRCPHLNQKGLCEIIINLGEDYLCHICREHPRFYNNLPNRREVGVGMACEEAARLILTAEDYGVVEIGEEDGEEYTSQFNARYHRDCIYELLQDEELPYDYKLSQISTRYGVNLGCFSNEFWQEIIENLEYLDASHRELFLAYSNNASAPAWCEKYSERALAYFIYRHCSNALNEYEFTSALGFCLFCERLLASLIVAQKANNLEDIALLCRIISEELEYSEDNTYAIMDEV